MKKQIMAIVLVTGMAVASVASVSWARQGNGGGWGNYPCQMNGGQNMMMPAGPMGPQLDAATQAKVQQFLKENVTLEKQIAMKMAEREALMESNTPDAKAVAQATGELFDLRVALFDKAQAAGVSQYMGPGFGRMGMGCAFGPGPGGRGGMHRGWRN